MGIGQARGKLLLFGEHAAVYGHPAVGCALAWGLSVHHEPGPQWVLPGLVRHEAAVLQLLDRFDALAVEEGLAKPARGTLTVETAIPLGSGFGSSGALCAALVNLFWPRLPLADRDRVAWKAEAVFHGTPSGIDTALALREGWWKLDASTRPVTSTPLPDPGLVLVAGAVVRDADTKSLVAGLASRRQDDKRVFEALERLGQLSATASSELSAGASAGIAPLVREARSVLRSLGLENPTLTSVINAGIAHGALAGKLSGAGGGGAFFLLFSDRSSAKQALKAIQRAAATELWTALPRLILS